MSLPFGNKPKTATAPAKSVGRVGTAGGAASKGATSTIGGHAILIKKYKQDDNKPLLDKYVPTTTLLEPNNNIPSWEAGDEEKKEVSSTLRKLRIKYDNINKLVREKENELEELKKKLEQKGEEEYKVEDALFRKTNYIVSAEDELSMIRDEHDFELMFQRSYYHMIDRIKKDIIALNISAYDLRDSNKQKEIIM
jgi:hypothetical protein